MVYLPLWKIWKSDGMMKFPTEWKNKIHVPNHQSVVKSKNASGWRWQWPNLDTPILGQNYHPLLDHNSPCHPLRKLIRIYPIFTQTEAQSPMRWFSQYLWTQRTKLLAVFGPRWTERVPEPSATEAPSHRRWCYLKSRSFFVRNLMVVWLCNCFWYI